MDLLDAIRLRRTTNNKFAPDPIKPEHIRLLIEAASRSPSHFNSQPWRFLLIRDQGKRDALAELAGASMKELMEGEFFQRYRRYFRFDDSEADGQRDGIYIDHMPAVLRPFIKQVFSPQSGKLLGMFGVSKLLGSNQADIVRESPLILAIAMNREEYKPGELSGLYSTISLGAVIQTFWLVTTSLNMGMQFISTPLEVPERKALIAEMLAVPPTHELVALFRMGYKADEAKRNSIDWTSSQRKPFDELAHTETWDAPMAEDLQNAPSLLWPEKAPNAKD
ncbi:MAG: nitroreductase family protein [Anaerolineae bacterium]|nr:nitroreductase family protein [Anaerolineae bacterium]